MHWKNSHDCEDRRYSFLHPFIHKYLWSIFYVSGTVLDIGVKKVNKLDKHVYGAYVLPGKIFNKQNEQVEYKLNRTTISTMEKN